MQWKKYESMEISWLKTHSLPPCGWPVSKLGDFNRKTHIIFTGLWISPFHLMSTSKSVFTEQFSSFQGGQWHLEIMVLPMQVRYSYTEWGLIMTEKDKFLGHKTPFKLTSPHKAWIKYISPFILEGKHPKTLGFISEISCMVLIQPL